MDLPEIHDMGMPDDGIQRIINKAQMVDNHGNEENITITVEGFNNPTAAAIAIMRFASDFVKMAISGRLGPEVMLSVINEMNQVINGAMPSDDAADLCGEHREELAERLKPSDQDFDDFLKSL